MTLQVGNKYTFQTYAPQYLGNFTNVEVVALVGFTSTAIFGVDVVAKHRYIVSDVPGLVDDPSKYNYVVIRKLDGTTDVLGVPWINQDTIEATSSVKAVVEVLDVSAGKLNDIKRALSSNGFTVGTINFVGE